MADFNLTIDSLSDSRSIASAVGEAYYPGGRQLVANTTFSQKGYINRSLTSRDFESILSGDALYRHPGFATTAYNRFVNSSFNSIVASGYDIGQLNTPSSTFIGGTGVKELDSTTVNGPKGFLNIIKNSQLDTGFASFNSQKSIATGFIDSANNSPTFYAYTDASGANINHGTLGTYELNGGGNGDTLGNFLATAAIPLLTESQKEVYKSFIRRIKTSGNFNENLSTFTFSRATVYIDGKVPSDTFVSGLDEDGYLFDINPNNIDSFFWGADISQKLADLPYGTRAYVCLSMLAMLDAVCVAQGIQMRANFGLSRARLVGASNLSTSTSTYSGVDPSGPTRHDYGRALDISEVNGVPVSEALEGYDKFLREYLKAIANTPHYLHPDTILVHPGYSEERLSSLRQEYPNLRPQTTIVPYAGHADHIHIHWDGSRAGNPDNFTLSSTGGSGGIDTSNIPLLDFQKDFLDVNASGALTPEAIYAIARNSGFNVVQSVIMTAIAFGESRGIPTAHNPNGEDSVGLWQINRDAHPWANDIDIFDPVQNGLAAYRVFTSSGSVFSPWSVTHANTGPIYASFLPNAIRASVALGEAGQLPGYPNQATILSSIRTLVEG